MRLVKSSLCALVLTWLGSSAVWTQQSQPAPSGPTLYENARLIAGDGSAAIENGALLVENGQIKAIGPKDKVTAPAGVTRVDLTNKTVIPTLIDVDVYTGYEGSPATRFAEFKADNWTPDNMVAHLQRAAFYGIGTMVGAGADEMGKAMAFVQDQSAGKFPPVARYIFAAGLELPAGGPEALVTKATKPLNALTKASTVEEARAAIQQLSGKGVRYVKVWINPQGTTYPKLTPESTRVYAAVYDEAHKHQMVVFTDARTLADQKAAVRGGTDLLVGTAEDVDTELLTLVKEKKTFWAPALGTGTDPAEWCRDPFVYQGLPGQALMTSYSATGSRGRAGCQAWSAEVAASQQKMEATIQKMVGAGARLVLGTDAGLGRYIFGAGEHYLLTRYVKAGATPAQTIQAATQWPAMLLGLKDAGTLAAGKRADFVVLNVNPLEDIRNTRRIDQVRIGGAMIQRNSLIAEWNKVIVANRARNRAPGGGGGDDGE